MAETKNSIALLIVGTATARGGLEPLVSVGVTPQVCAAEPVNALLKEELTYMLRHTATHKCYTLIDRKVRPYGSVRKGTLSISIAISRQMQLANGRSPYSLLMEIYHTFVALNMWEAPTGEHIFNEGECSRDIFQSLLGKYRLEAVKDETYVEMPATGRKALVCVESDEKLALLLRDSQYPEFKEVSQVEVGRLCAPTINIDIPRKQKEQAQPQPEKKPEPKTNPEPPKTPEPPKQPEPPKKPEPQKHPAAPTVPPSTPTTPSTPEKKAPKPEKKQQEPVAQQLTVEFLSRDTGTNEYKAVVWSNGSDLQVEEYLDFVRDFKTGRETARLKLPQAWKKAPDVYVQLQRIPRNGYPEESESRQLFFLSQKVQIDVDSMTFTFIPTPRSHSVFYIAVGVLALLLGMAINFMVSCGDSDDNTYPETAAAELPVEDGYDAQGDDDDPAVADDSYYGTVADSVAVRTEVVLEAPPAAESYAIGTLVEDEPVAEETEPVVLKAKEPEVVHEDSKVYDVVEDMPKYPGGDEALMRFLSSNIMYPAVAEENGIQGRVSCSFIVERDGTITDVKVVKSVDPSLDKEAVRVIKAMPHWLPGRQDGQAVRVKYLVPINFRLQ